MAISTFKALRHRNFRIFLIGQIFSLVGIWAQRMAQAWLVYDLTHSAAWLGIVEAFSALPMFFFSLIGGSLADRLPKKMLLVIIHLVAMIVSMVYALLIWSGRINIFFISVLAFISGILLAFEVPTRQSFYVELVGRDDLTNAIALNSATFNMARLVGPAIGGFLVARYGVAWCMFLNSLSYTTLIIALLLIRLDRMGNPSRAGISFRKSLKQVWYYIRDRRPVKGLLILIGSTTIFGWSFIVILPVFAREVLGGGAVMLGKLMSAAGLGALVAAIVVAAVSDRVPPRRLVFTGLYTFVLAILTLSFSQNTLLSLFSVSVAGFGLVMFYINANSALQRRVPHELRGRIMGVYALTFGGFMPLGSLQIGFVAEHIGVQKALFICSVLLATFGFLISRWVPPVKPANESPRPSEH